MPKDKRPAVERMTQRIVEHNRLTGAKMPRAEAKKIAVEAAKRHDRKHGD